MASEVLSMLWNQVAERASAKEEASILQAEIDSWTRRLETEKNELQSIMEKEKLYSEEMDIKQLQADLVAIVRGNDILKYEVRNALDTLSYAIPKLKYLELQLLKKDENINQLTNDLQECMKELGIVKEILPKVFQERDFMALHLGLLYVGSLVVLLVYSILYGLTEKKSNWLGATTSAAVIILVIRLREGFHRNDQNSSASSSEGCGSSIKCSSSADAGHIDNAIVPCTSDGSTWNNIEGINSDKSIDSERLSLALRSSSYRSVVQETEVGSSYVDRKLEHNSSLFFCSSSGLESQGCDSSTSTSANQQILDLNFALAFQEKLSDPRITSMLKRKGRHTDHELANLLQDKGLDPNFAVMLKENGLDPMILALL
ncbi:hypothetical protein FXO37_00750 [Capsicum annuum]|nr:hypothetical protein FXO37_00750 [Capsicum annuum]